MVAMNGSAPWNGGDHAQVERDEEIHLLDEADCAFGMLLRSEDPEPMYPVESLGPYSGCYREMLAAYDAAYAETDDTERAVAAARSVLLGYVAQDPDHFAGFRSADWSPRPRRGWSVAELYAAEFPEPRYLVPGLLPSGLAALAARPKIGKSWMALQVAVAVGVGGQVFGEQTKKGRVLYLALEDSIRRMKLRLQKQGRRRQPTSVLSSVGRPFCKGGWISCCGQSTTTVTSW